MSDKFLKNCSEPQILIVIPSASAGSYVQSVRVPPDPEGTGAIVGSDCCVRVVNGFLRKDGDAGGAGENGDGPKLNTGSPHVDVEVFIGGRPGAVWVLRQIQGVGDISRFSKRSRAYLG